MSAENANWDASAIDAAWEDFQARREVEQGGRCVDLNVSGSYKFWYATKQSTSARTSATLTSLADVTNMGGHESAK